MRIYTKRTTIIRKRTLLYVLIVLVTVLGSFTYYVELTRDHDFVRIQSAMMMIQDSNINLIDYMKTAYGFTTNTSISYSYSFKVLLYMVSTHFKNRYVLVWLSVLIDYLLVSYIAYDWGKDRKYTYKEIVCAFLMCCAMLPYVHAVSGLRTATACCIMGFAVYRFLYRRAKWIEFLIECFLAATFHQVTIFAIPIAIAMRISSTWKWIIGIVAAMSLMPRLIELLAQIGGPFFGMIARKYFSYTNAEQFTSSRLVLYSIIFFCIIYILYFIFCDLSTRKPNDSSQKNFLSNEKKSIYMFIVCYTVLILGNVGSYEMVVRPAYLLGVLSPVISHYLFLPLNTRNSKMIAFFCRSSIFVVMIIAIYALIRNFGSVFSITNIPKSLFA